MIPSRAPPRKLIHTKCRVLLAVFCSIFSSSAALAETDFSGRTIEWIIPFREGGGADIWARFNAPFIAKYLPGQPQIVVKNDPGGGSTKGANRYSRDSKSDGFALLGTSASTQFPYLLGDSRVRYDYDDWRILMVYQTGGVVYVRPELGLSDASQLRELRDRKLTFGSQGPTSLDLVPMLAFELLGLNVRPIFGIRGRRVGQLAFERGDATIDYQTSAAYIRNIQPLVDAGKAVPLFTLGSLNPDGELIRDPEFPELPHVGEVYSYMHQKPPSGLAWDSWFAFFSAGFGAQKLLVIPKDTPSDVVLAYQAALEAMQRDPDYIARKPSVLGAYDQVTGDAAQRLYGLASDIPSGPRQWIRDWLRRKYGLNI